MGRFNASMSASQVEAALQIHNSGLISRGVTSCPNGCTCDWEAQDCNGKKTYYRGSGPTPVNTRITLVNKCPKTINVKARTPCMKQTGDSIVKIPTGSQSTISQDFIVIVGAAEKVSDQFS